MLSRAPGSDLEAEFRSLLVRAIRDRRHQSHRLARISRDNADLTAQSDQVRSLGPLSFLPGSLPSYLVYSFVVTRLQLRRLPLSTSRRNRPPERRFASRWYCFW